MTSSITLGWGLVGLGKIAGNEIAPAIASLGNSELVTVVSRDQQRADAFAATHGAARGTDDFASMLRDDAVQAVYIATPNALHAEMAIAAARAGKHVLCDKPIATTVTDAEQVVAECEKAGVCLGVTFQTRNHDGMADVRALVADGKIGSVVVAEVEMSSGRTGLKGWRTDPALAGMGTMNNIGVHGYDLLGYLLGAEVTEVTVLLGKEPEYKLDTTVLALLRFDNGALAYVNANQSVPGHRPDMVLYGTEGRVVGHNVTRPNRKGRYDIQDRDGESSREADTSGAYRKTVGDFADAALQGREPSPSGLDGLRSVRLTDAMARSAAERATVRLDS